MLQRGRRTRQMQGGEAPAAIRDSDGAVAWLAPCGADAYPRTVLRMFFAPVDRRIADLMLAHAQRRWPLLRLVPRTCVRPMILPAARVARQHVLSLVVISALLAGTLPVLIPAL